MQLGERRESRDWKRSAAFAEAIYTALGKAMGSNLGKHSRRLHGRPDEHQSSEFQLTFPKLFELMIAPFAFMQLMNIVVS